jgi:Ca2+-dependent lipid-binding protein
MQVSNTNSIYYLLIIYSSRNLINVHRQNLPDPYVRVTLSPDFKKDKKKTKSIHDTLNPVYDDL